MKIRGKFDVINLIAWIFVRGFSLELYYTLHVNTAVCLLKYYYYNNCNTIIINKEYR